ncbi:MAG TPA: pyruvate dehydrogenase complex dihydrolipoamide acetyltransferase [Hellea balneolensis]|uniref:Acetyltransferase component of pyruvate dehydrogenase complex n=1 Tax=Hellea balneolensis TaxID=287478 RepID=A0A7C5R0A2_9PROT|nr:pyruvate dehydrogenase complex dihydrolipoamide acetyltransferase [Hellea balneolensis]
MPIEILMPSLSAGMETGNLVTWMVKEGDTISVGDVLAEIETDKATLELESSDAGVLTSLLVEDGTDDIPVGQVIAVLGGDRAHKDRSENKPEQSKPVHEQTDSPSVQPQHILVNENTNRVKASPLARRLAKHNNVDLTGLRGSGPLGRIVKQDVETAIADFDRMASTTDVVPNEKPALIPVPSNDPGTPFHVEKLSSMRKTIAQRLTLSKTTVPHFYLTISCQIDKLLEQRKMLNALIEDQGGRVSVNDFIIRAAGLALQKVPEANVGYAGDEIHYFERADIAVAVAVQGGLITPIIRGACQKGLGQISRDMKILAEKARTGTLTPDEYKGGTFSISNLGMYGIQEFSAVINPPQSAILAIGAGEERPIMKDGVVIGATMMSCTLSCDHRAIDGAVAAEFLQVFKSFIENPLTMLL